MNNKEEVLFVKMDKNLKLQLQRYADREDEGVVSRSARKAIKLFLKENK
jgi:hypothetical protein